MTKAGVRRDVPGRRSAEYLRRWSQSEALVTGYQAQVVWDHATGARVYDVDGHEYIDWTSGVLVTNVGHCHPRLVAAVREAAGRLLNNYECANVERVEAAERLVAALPAHLDRCFFLTTGSETTEAASRLMRRARQGYEIISFHGAFHGRTSAAASMGGLPGPKRSYGPVLPGAIRAPYPYPYRDPLGWCSDGPDFKRYFDFLESVVGASSTGSLAGVIVEPYLGAGGFVFPPEGWLRRLEVWAHDRGLLFTLDEVQSSYGRTGRMWAMEHENLKPDIVCIGKAIGSGVAVSAVAARSEVFAALRRGELSSTLGGNPVASAAVSAVLDIFRDEPLVENAVRIGEVMRRRLEAMKDSCPYLGDVRGKGLVMGMEFVRDRATKEPAPELIPTIIDRCAAHGLLVGAVGIHGNVIRVAPPLVIRDEEVDTSLEVMETVLSGLSPSDIEGKG